MEYSLSLRDIDEANDIFLLAKDRLLDVNDWNTLFEGNDYNILLTDAKGNKLHRNARVNDKIQISAVNGRGIKSDMWVQVSQVQYDDFPDINSESISMLLMISFSPSGNGIDLDDEQAEQSMETIIIRRENNNVTAHCNIGNELPEEEDEVPDAHINRNIELHPVLSIPKTHLKQLLRGFVAVESYT